MGFGAKNGRKAKEGEIGVKESNNGVKEGKIFLDKVFKRALILYH
jgi:hypothetical protein